MSIRPMDMQVNIMKESDNAKLVQKDKIHEEGQTRYAPQLEKEQEIRNENVQELEKSGLKTVDDDHKGGGQKQPGENRERAKEETKAEKVEVKDPTRGTVIDIKS